MLSEYDHFYTKKPFYNGYNLLSALDKNGQKPELLISTSNRSAGKTTFFNGNALHQYLKNGKKFLILYRNKYEYKYAAESFFGEIGKLFYPDLIMKQETAVENVFDNLYVGKKMGEDNEWEHCGYTTSLSACEQIKRYSHLLDDCDIIIFDEFLPESGKYLKDETTKLESIHRSLARGGGRQVRFLPILLIGNLIDIFNPYYEMLGIVDDLQIETKIRRGDGWVLEQGFNEASAQSYKESAFAKVFKGSKYSTVSSKKEYANTNYNLIDNSVCDIGLYICTIRYNKKLYSVRYNDRGGFYFVSNTPDPNVIFNHAATEEDISIDSVYDPSNRYRRLLKDRFRANQVKFKNLSCRSAALHFIAGK